MSNKSLRNLTRSKSGFTQVTDGYSGFQSLLEVVSTYMKATEKDDEAMLAGAKAFTSDLLKLPKPMSRIKKAGYTHLVRTFAYESNEKEVVVGWGKYYGPMLEHGTVKMNAQPHIYPLWDKNKEKYYKTMLTKLGVKTW